MMTAIKWAAVFYLLAALPLALVLGVALVGPLFVAWLLFDRRTMP